MLLKVLSESQKYTSVICHMSSILQECDARGNMDLPWGSKECLHIYISDQKSVNPGEVQDACLALFSLNPRCWWLHATLHVLHFRPDLLEESHQTENLTNKPQRTSDLIGKYVSLLVNVGTARASINGEHICY